jgi:hypothetical protein
MRLGINSQLGYGFYVKLTPIITAKPLHIASITGWFNADVETFPETSLQCGFSKGYQKLR